MQLQIKDLKTSVWLIYQCIHHHPQRCVFSGHASSSSFSPRSFHTVKNKTGFTFSRLNENQQIQRVKPPTSERETGGTSFSGLGDSRLVSILGGESGITENMNIFFFSFVNFSEELLMLEGQKLAIFITAVWFRLLNPTPLLLLSFFLLAVRLHSFGFALRGRQLFN